MLRNNNTTWDSTEARLRGLLIAGVEGDEASYLSFLKELSAFLRAFFRRRLFQRPSDVEDLVQETLLAVHNQRHTYNAALPLTAWVHAIAKYKLVDALRIRNGVLSSSVTLDEAEGVFSETRPEEDEARIDIAGLLGQLPDRYRLPIVHVKLEGLSVKEAASLTGMSESAIKVGIHRGLKVLAAKIRGVDV